MNSRTDLLKSVLEKSVHLKENILTFMVSFLESLIKTSTVNWSKIANAMEGDALPESKYKRIQRYFRGNYIPEWVWAHLILTWFPQATYRLSMDRTTWQAGQNTINYLVLAIVVRKAALPIYWKEISKPGNSTNKDRIELIQKFIADYGVAQIDSLVADREFASREFIQYLWKHCIDFLIRIQQGTRFMKPDASQEELIQNYINRAQPKNTCILRDCTVWGIPVSIVIRPKQGDPVVLITTKNPNQALDEYRNRWKIEELFQNMKSRGFQLESTCVKNSDRLHQLLGFLTLAYAWCFMLGERLDQEKPIRRKTHKRLAQSVFRLGFDSLSRSFLCSASKQDGLMKLVEMLFPSTKDSPPYTDRGIGKAKGLSC